QAVHRLRPGDQGDGRGRQDRERPARRERPAERSDQDREDRHPRGEAGRERPRTDRRSMTLTPSLPGAAAKFLTGFVGEGWTAQPLLGDASTRQYFRVRLAGGGTRILAYYPPELRPQLRRFLDAYAAVSPHARVPEVLAYDDACTLQTDVGDRTLFDLLHERHGEALPCYERAIEMLVSFQRAGTLDI